MSFQEGIDGFVGSEVESCFGGLVVGRVLGGHAEAVGDVLHQAVDAVVGGDGADVESQHRALVVAQQQLGKIINE